MKLDGDVVADGDRSGVAEEIAVGIGGDGKAAFKEFEGIAFFELKFQEGEALAMAMELAIGAEAEFGLAFIETKSECGDARAKIVGEDEELGVGKTFASEFEASAEGEGEIDFGVADAFVDIGEASAKIDASDANLSEAEAFARGVEAIAKAAG